MVDKGQLMVNLIQTQWTFRLASSDGTIKFLEKQHNQWKLIQPISNLSYVYSLSLNESQNQLISSNYYSILVRVQQIADKKWVQIQKIELNQSGFRLNFINDNQFTFQPQYGQYMNLQEWNNMSKEYVKTKDILLQSGNFYFYFFPQQFIKEKSILINKFGEVLNVIKIKQEWKIYQLIQQIQFESFGYMDLQLMMEINQLPGLQKQRILNQKIL